MVEVLEETHSIPCLRELVRNVALYATTYLFLRILFSRPVRALCEGLVYINL